MGWKETTQLVQEAVQADRKWFSHGLGSVRKENVRELLLPTVAPEGRISDL